MGLEFIHGVNFEQTEVNLATFVDLKILDKNPSWPQHTKIRRL